jgi:hypothetical protein
MSGVPLEVSWGIVDAHCFGKGGKEASHVDSILESGATQFPFITQLK